MDCRTDYGLQTTTQGFHGLPFYPLHISDWSLRACKLDQQSQTKTKQSPLPLTEGPGKEKPNRDLVLTAIREPCGICCLIHMSSSPKAPAGDPDPVPQVGTGSWAIPTAGPAAVGPVIPWPSTQWHKANQAQQSLPLTPESGLATPGAHGRASFPCRQWQRHM